MTQPPQARPQLLPERAFVIQFTTAADLLHGRVEGRVEHVVSGQATRFHSMDSLVGFIARVLTAGQLPGLR